MAANLTQMGGGQLGRRQQGNQQLSQFIYAQIMTQQVPTTGWHSSVPPNARLGHAMNIVTNSFLALPNNNINVVVEQGVTFERDAFSSSPDKATYEARIMGRVNELFKKRQANEQNLQNTLSHGAAQNQAQLMMNQSMRMGGLGQPMPQGFPTLQQPMQTSPVNQQGQPNLGVNNPNGLPMNPNQQMMQMGAQIRPQMAMQSGMATLPPQDRVKAHQLALAKINSLPEPARSQYRTMVQQKFGTQLLTQLQQEGIDPLMYFFQSQFAAQILQGAKGQAGVNQPGMPMQAHQQRPTNQPAQQLPTGPNGEYGPFAKMQENIINQQNAGLMAQEAGQMVVPASSGAGRNATPQPIGSLPGPGQGPGQPALPHQLPQHFNHQPAQQLKMDQRAAQTQAQIRAQAQAKQMQGQPGGLNGLGGASQSPGMNTLNAPVRRTPMGVGQIEGHPQLGQGNMPFGQQRMDPRFNQLGQRTPMGPNGNMNRNQMLNSLLAQMPAEAQQQIMSMPPEKMPEMIMRWNATRGAGPIAGRPQPQIGQLGPVNPISQPMNQFPTTNNGLGQHPNMNMPMNQQNQLMMQQMNKLRNPNISQASLNQQQALMDNMNIPPRIMEQLRNSIPQGGVSPDLKKWGQLKQWMEQKNLSPQFIQNMLKFQTLQFQNFLKNQAGVAAANSQPPQANMPQQGIHLNGQANPQMVQPTPGMAGPNMNITISPQELQNARNHEKFKGWPEDKIREMLMRYKMQALKRAANQMPAPPVQASQVAQLGQTPTAPTPSQPTNSSAVPQRQPNAGPEISTASPAVQARNIKQPPNRAAPNAPAASTAKTGMKRPMPDDAAETPNTSSTPIQRPHAQQQQPGASVAPPQIPQLSPEQLASMSPEKRQRYEAIVRGRQSATGSTPMSDEMVRLKAIGQEQHQAALKEQLPDIPMTTEQYRDTAQKIQAMCGEMNKISKILARWYFLTHNDERAKQFFKFRMRLIKQYVDGDKMTMLKERLSITAADLDSIKILLESIVIDAAALYPQGMRKNLSQQNAPESASQGAPTQQGVTATQPTPLNAANLEKQTQALNRMHQRNNSRAGQAPAAPTTAQPPFPFGAQSPDGQPTYAGKPSVTQDNLQLPARKKVKTEARAGTGPGQIGTGANASPQVQKLSSPEMSKRQAPAESKQASAVQKFFCKDPYCDSRNIGFTTEETLRKHKDEEHDKPAEDPMKFAIGGLAEVLGLDANGKAKKMHSASSNIQSPGDTSKSLQTPAGRADPANSRDAPMKRQGSTTSTKPNELIKTIAGKASTPKPDSLSRAMDGATPGMALQSAGGESIANTIDPQELLSGVTGLEMGGGGAILDMNVYRAITPNDTPESSKDSASSEPNSDVSEGVALNVTLDVGLDMGFGTWDPFGFGLDPGTANMELGSVDNFSNLSYPPLWDEINPDFDKPFAIDTSMFSLDTSSS
ncbi:hypothetical protein F5Y10DRAFT_265496 [Nemania abortiva]|nr:hypothetical protein F5Y10DRAFT_265496 [Nemania abortiva]